jgi:hypothetical protein
MGGCLPGKFLVLVFDLADIEAVAQQIMQRAAAKRDATACRARCKLFGPGLSVASLEIPYQFIDTAEFEIAAEHRSNQFSFFFDNSNLPSFSS